MKNTLFVAALVAASIALAGCAQQPTEEINAALAAHQQASASEVAEYAPESVNAANDAKAGLEDELKLQGEKLALFRDYKRTSELAAQLKSTSESAVSDAEVARGRARDDATSAIADARRTLEETRAMLAEAPTGKGVKADVLLLTSDLDGVEGSIGEAEAALSAGRFKEALTKASAAKSAAENVREQVVAAKQARTGQRPSQT